MGYLSGLNALRFFAAFFVIVSHGQISLWKLGVVEAPKAAFFNRGGDGVEFFFTLSGFLITGLLVKEFEKTGTVSLRKFYLRRVLRIWPLYFFAVISGFVILGFLYPRIFGQAYFEFSIAKGLLLFIFFLPNLATSFYPTGLLYPLWSIGVEEQYYLFWAPLIKKFRLNIPGVIITFLIFSYTLYVVMHFNLLRFSPSWVKFFLSMKFYAMATGGLFSYLFLSRNKLVYRYLLFKGILPSVLVVFVLWHYLIGFPFSEGFWFHLLVPFAYGVVILTTVSPRRIINLEINILTYLGIISYGLYMYHMFIDYSLRIFFMKSGKNFLQTSLIGPFLYHILLFGFTVLIASLSYRYFESYFLKIKHKYA